MSSDPKSMGELFVRRRAAAAAASGGKAGGEADGDAVPGGARRKKSLVDIQREQQRDQERDRRWGNARSRRAPEDRSRLHRPLVGGRPDLHSPREQGVVKALMDRYGFILCADRDAEIFFHFSECEGVDGSGINIGDEVEFRVGEPRDGGGGEGSRNRALDVRVLPAGTIWWEREDDPAGSRQRGRVERVAREERGGGMGGMVRGRGSSGQSAGEGLILLLSGSGDKEDSGTSLEARYAAVDYRDRRPSHSRLERGDVVEFTLVTERRTGGKRARNIVLLRSERERRRDEREAKLLEVAEREEGRVASRRGDYGFIRSVMRGEEVYFHISHVQPSEEGARAPSLREGQDVEFYVVDEGGSGRRGPSARRIRALPLGTVKFERMIAQGVTGVVAECPVGAVREPMGRRDDGGGVCGRRGMTGRVRLQNPIALDDGADGGPLIEVTLPSDSFPGGTHDMGRAGSESWIRPGDVLLFDVVSRLVDGAYLAAPTTCLRPGDGLVAGARPSVRLVELSVCGRAEGIVRSVHDNYGFVRLAERAADAYFPLHEVLPPELQTDLARNDPEAVNWVESECNEDEDDRHAIRRARGRVRVEVGMEVSFDLSAQAPTAPRSRSGGNTRERQEKESLRARRLRVLEAGTVKEKIIVVRGARATVVREDLRQPFAGTLELEEVIRFDALRGRHPLVHALLEDVLGGRYGEEGAMFQDAVSDKEGQVVISMVNARNDLEWSYAPEVGEASAAGEGGVPYGRRLCVARRKVDNDTRPVGDARRSGTGSTVKEVISTNSGAEEDTTIEGKTNAIMIAGEEGSLEEDEVGKQDSSNKKAKKAKVLRQLRFDSSSFPDASIGDVRLGVGIGDIVTCDVFQLRRSGVIVVENILVERKERPAVAAIMSKDHVVKENVNGFTEKQLQKGLVGVVTEVVGSRHFGFITTVDEKAGKMGGQVFFHFKEIKSGGENAAQDESPSAATAAEGGRINRPSGRGNSILVRKGDEVKFNVGPGKNGKLSATDVSFLPHGTLKIPVTAADQPSSSSCTGYILMEPSHTSLANTPSHSVPQSAALAAPGSGGRWDNVRDDKSPPKVGRGSSIKEEGVILLLTDPAHLFTSKPNGDVSILATESSSGSEAAASPRIELSKDREDASKCSSEAGGKDDEGTIARPAFLLTGTHLRYRPTSMAPRGAGIRSGGPRRGDLVSFGRTKGGSGLVRDVRIEKVSAATSLKGVLVDIDREGGTAIFLASRDGNELAKKYEIKLIEVVSCDGALLKDREEVNGILHEGKIFGVCRTKDISLKSSIGRNSSGSSGGLKERPRLNLTVKKELQGMGGQIMAQSRMAKGPDGTIGFTAGWTRRASPYEVVREEATSLSAAASEFVPQLLLAKFPIAASGFEYGKTGDDESARE